MSISTAISYPISRGPRQPQKQDSLSFGKTVSERLVMKLTCRLTKVWQWTDPVILRGIAENLSPCGSLHARTGGFLLKDCFSARVIDVRVCSAHVLPTDLCV